MDLTPRASNDPVDDLALRPATADARPAGGEKTHSATARIAGTSGRWRLHTCCLRCLTLLAWGSSVR